MVDSVIVALVSIMAVKMIQASAIAPFWQGIAEDMRWFSRANQDLASHFIGSNATVIINQRYDGNPPLFGMSQK